ELDGDRHALEGILADNLVFRRAGGSIVVKDEYLDSLEATRYEENVQEDVKVALFEPAAVVSLNIRAKGIRNQGKPDEGSFKGLYHNTRLFVKSQEDWQLAVWYNTPVDQT
ncbi:MAG: nuclear transport factor 2 family protein, partial [Chloroflexia bacterium]